MQPSVLPGNSNGGLNPNPTARSSDQINQGERQMQQLADHADTNGQENSNDMMNDDSYQLSLRLNNLPPNIRGALDPFNTAVGMYIDIYISF